MGLKFENYHETFWNNYINSFYVLKIWKQIFPMTSLYESCKQRKVDFETLM